MTIEEVNLLDKNGLAKKNFNKNNVSFEIWYEALQHYADLLEDSYFNRQKVIECGEDSWKYMYDYGYGIKLAFIEGFSD